jgi:hypothetical protein
VLVAGGIMAVRCDRQVEDDVSESARTRRRPFAVAEFRLKLTLNAAVYDRIHGPDPRQHFGDPSAR